MILCDGKPVTVGMLLGAYLAASASVSLAEIAEGAEEERPAVDPNRVRGLLAFEGASIREWARAHGYRDAYVHLAMRGHRRGPKARRIVAELQEELGL